MKTDEVTQTIIGRRCRTMFAGEMTPGIIKEISITKHEAHVKVLFDEPQHWHDSLFYSDWAIGYREDESGSLKFLTLSDSDESETSPYETIFVTFAEPILNLDAFFDDPNSWGTSTLKGWIDSYESSRFTQTGPQTAVITSEYNMKPVREWLEKWMPIDKITMI